MLYKRNVYDSKLVFLFFLVEDFLSTPRKRRVAPYRRPSLVKEDLERKQREKEQLENEGAKNYGKFY